MPDEITAEGAAAGFALLAGAAGVVALLLSIWLESSKWLDTSLVFFGVAFVLCVIAILADLGRKGASE